MRILVDCIPFDHGESGISVYIANVVHQLKEQGHDLTLVVTQEDEPFFPGYKFLRVPRWARKPVGSIFYHLFVLPWRVSPKHFDCCLVPAGNRRALGFNRVFTIAVVHDIAQCRLAEKYDSKRNLWVGKILPHYIRKVDRVVTISKSTARDVEQFWHIPQERQTVIYNGLSLPEAPRKGFLEHFKLQPQRYIMYVSRLEHPGKNHINLVKAYERLSPSLRDKYPLVLVGSLWSGAEHILEYIHYSDAANTIRLTGFINSNDLPEAYSNAAMYVFPSKYEGFGLSLIEAMHFGCPCCCSNNSSLGEIGEGAALLFDPDKPEEISKCIRDILDDAGGIREKLIEDGYQRAACFSWEKHVRKIVELVPLKK